MEDSEEPMVYSVQICCKLKAVAPGSRLSVVLTSEGKTKQKKNIATESEMVQKK